MNTAPTRCASRWRQAPARATICVSTMRRCSAAGNFANKIWNASRFVAMNLRGPANSSCDLSGLELDIADKWILTRLNRVAAEVTENMEKFELGLACGKVYDFIWSEFCDWYIEMCKAAAV